MVTVNELTFLCPALSVSARSAGAYAATLYVMVDKVKGGGRAPPPSPGWHDFSIMMECTPESGFCHSIYVSIDSYLFAPKPIKFTYMEMKIY
jgi:hypothetical protein